MVKPSTKLQMPLSESKFPFSKRMLTFFTNLEISTVGQLAEIPLSQFTCFRGFKGKCMDELNAFVAFEQLEDYFVKS